MSEVPMRPLGRSLWSLGVVLASACLLQPRPALSQGSGAAPELKAAVAKLVQQVGIGADQPGVAVLVARPGWVVLMEGYGVSNLASKEPITACTSFELASVSKTFTATAVLILHERGLLSIEDDIRKYIPELPQYPSGPIRIRDLLNHTSGLPDYMDLDDVSKRDKPYWTNVDYLEALGKAKLDFPTGRKYEYNNTNYLLAALVVERAGKKPFADFMRDEIFVPSGMKNSFINASLGAAPSNIALPCNNAIGYEKSDGRWAARWGLPPTRQEKHLEVGDGGVWSNLEDMAAWDTAIRSDKLLKPATMKLALTGSRQNKGYGLGWDLYSDTNGPIYGFGHDGYWRGFTTTYYNYYSGNHTIVLLSNRGHEFENDEFWKKLSDLVARHAPE